MTRILGVALAVFGLSALAQQGLVQPVDGGTTPQEARWSIMLASAAFGAGMTMARRSRKNWTFREEALHRLYLRSRTTRPT